MGSYPPTPPPHEHEIVHGSPEFLPPGTGTFTSPPPARRRRSGWAASPATYFLVGINCAVYIAMVFKGVSAVSPTTDQLMHWGANNAGSVLIGAQWWRIVTAMFVHVGFLHLATNMWCLWNLGLLAEPLMGSWGVMAVYILTGAGRQSAFHRQRMVVVSSGVGSLPCGRRSGPQRNLSSRRRSLGGSLWNRRRADRAAQVGSVARAARRTEETAQVGYLFCRTQPGARPVNQRRI